MSSHTLTEDARKALKPIVGEEIGNCGGNTHVIEVLSDNVVRVKNPHFEPYLVTCDRGTHGGLMAVDLV